MSAQWIAFVGPSLPSREAAAFGCVVRPPARQGDVWRALADHPRAIVLIDGVFESVPSVWHHELRAALASGVAVFGAASMGALRAAELGPHGMIGVGEIFRDYRDGRRVDDADVALLHADKEHRFRALTLPLVNAEHAVGLARKEKIITAAEQLRLRLAARAIHYQLRQWPVVLEAAQLRAASRKSLLGWLGHRRPDAKAEDARACLKLAAEWVASGAPSPSPVPCAESSFVRRRRLVDAGGKALEKLQRARDAEALSDAGTRRRLLAGWARAMGLVAEPARTATLLESLPRAGLAADERARLAEDLALERQLLDEPQRWLADGPTRLEGLAEEAKRLGRWRG